MPLVKTTRITLRVRVRISWWARLYVAGVAATSRLTGLKPNWAKVAAVVRRGTRIVLED